VLSIIYSGITWLIDNSAKLGNLLDKGVAVFAAIADLTHAADPAAVAARRGKLADAVEAVLTDAIVPVLSFAVSEVGLKNLPKSISDALTNLQKAPRDKVVAALTKVKDKALGRSRGGFGPTIPAAVNGLGLPARRTLSPGRDADIAHADGLLAGFAPAVVIADKGSDEQALVDAIKAKGGEAVIPARTKRTVSREIDADRSKDRDLVGRFWAEVDQDRQVATRSEKTARNFL
jgi:hypothetical protein